MTSPICESVAVCMDRKYYQAYEDRYKQVHRKNLSWFSSAASQIVMDTIRKYYGEKSPKMLDKGYDVTGVDISAEAIKFCKAKAGETDKHRFQVLDVCTQGLPATYDFIYSVATLHMLLKDEDRKNYLAFIFNHLEQNGYGLILTIGDGIEETQSDAGTAFEM